MLVLGTGGISFHWTWDKGITKHLWESHLVSKFQEKKSRLSSLHSQCLGGHVDFTWNERKD